MPEITILKAQKIVYALKGKGAIGSSLSILEFTSNIFINTFGEIIISYNETNYKSVGKVINEKRFQIGKELFDF